MPGFQFINLQNSSNLFQWSPRKVFLPLSCFTCKLKLINATWQENIMMNDWAFSASTTHFPGSAEIQRLVTKVHRPIWVEGKDGGIRGARWIVQTSALHCSLNWKDEHKFHAQTQDIYWLHPNNTYTGTGEEVAHFGSHSVKVRFSGHTFLKRKHTPYKTWFRACKCMDHIQSCQANANYLQCLSRTLQAIAAVSTTGKRQNCAILHITDKESQ